MSEVFTQLANRVREIARGEARSVSPPVDRFKVVDVDPLVLRQLNGEEVLEEGDEDFEIAEALWTAPGPEVGDLVVVHQDSDGDWVATALVKTGDDD